MKGIKKYLFIMAALAAVFGFVACGDDEEEPGTVAEYTATETIGDVNDGGLATMTYTATFRDDKTFSVTVTGSGVTLPIMEGTYEGDPSKDSTVKMTFKKVADDDMNLVDPPSDFPASVDVEIKDGKFTFDDWDFTRK